tara:strand:+ start:360 stop:548 length:189 start_codon:yes stop_codon:yes gene_type:complete
MDKENRELQELLKAINVIKNYLSADEFATTQNRLLAEFHTIHVNEYRHNLKMLVTENRKVND